MTLPSKNLLAGETSPYLRQHADNPVHWRGWSAKSLEEAKSLDRPILLSIGYAACHWCHVMAHESFENPDIAAVMNALFVNIKVDREERPDIDQIYMAALTAMGEQGGWPLTMFLTPDAKPFWGGTYFPPEPRYGRAGFVQILHAVDKAWRDKRQSIVQSAAGLTDHITARLTANSGKRSIQPDMLKGLASGISDLIDRQSGGLRGAPKFPNAPFMQTLWLSWLHSGDLGHRESVLTSLTKMLAGGIYDHVGGGLSRYSTDDQWLVPHFEKMLYDNAQLIRLCNWAYASTENVLFRVRSEETIAWALREMRIGNGAFASSLDADSDDEEGLFYTWDPAEIVSCTGATSNLFFSFFTLTQPAGWEGKPIIHQTDRQQTRSMAEVEGLSALKGKLLSDREKRIRPGRDEKILTDWNGLMIAALAESGRALGRADWIDAASAAFAQIIASGREGRLPHSTLGDSKLFPALSSDYAAMANAAISLFEATQDTGYINHAKGFIAQLNQWHGDDSGTGHHLSAVDSKDVLIRIRGDVDEAIPSATSQIIEALARLASLTGDLDLHAKAFSVAEHAAGRIANQAYGQAGIVNACSLASQPLKLAIVESPSLPRLVPVANRNPDPRRIDIVIPLGSESREILPGGVSPPTDRPGAYLCQGQTCLPAITDPAELESHLRQPG